MPSKKRSLAASHGAKWRCNDRSLASFYGNNQFEKRWRCCVCDSYQPNDLVFINLHLDKCCGKVDSATNTESLKVNGATGDSGRSSMKRDAINAIFPIDRSRIITSKDVPGLFIIYNFLSAEEELLIVEKLDADDLNPWKFSSFNGHCYSKGYGMVTKFGERIVRKNDMSRGEYDMPVFLDFVHERFRDILRQHPQMFPPCLHRFRANECNMNSYLKSRKDTLKPHFDDRYLSGEVLMNLSLMGASFMTYIDEKDCEVDIHLPRCCLQLVTESARYDFKHSIKEVNLLDERRVSITWRQAGLVS